MEQNSEEWRNSRIGQVSASRLLAVMAKGKNGAPSATRENLMADLIAERLTGVPMETFKSDAMQWGTDTEPLARQWYEEAEGVFVEQCGYIPHPTIAHSGASPDGLVGDDGLVEIKCPKTATHIATLLGSSIDRGYMLQMQWQMECTGRQWCDFVSFDPRMPPAKQGHCRRVQRDEAMLTEIRAAVTEFLAEMDDKLERLK